MFNRSQILAGIATAAAMGFAPTFPIHESNLAAPRWHSNDHRNRGKGGRMPHRPTGIAAARRAARKRRNQLKSRRA